MTPSDVYSLGVILYELLTGSVPFEGPAYALLARVVADDPPSPRRFNHAVPRDLEAICLKALAKRPEDRYESAAALAADLRSFRAGCTVKARHVTWFNRLRRSLARHQQEVLMKGWPRLLLALGLTILVGCSVANYWQITVKDAGRQLLLTMLTKGIQVAVMLFFAVRLRPVKAGGLTVVERQVWCLVPAYYGGFLALVVVNHFLDEPLPMAPILAVMSGMGFCMLGASLWGWFYVWGAFFFGLAVLIVLAAPTYGLTLLGVGWFLCMLGGGLHLHFTRMHSS
jgi:hypothetical protein